MGRPRTLRGRRGRPARNSRARRRARGATARLYLQPGVAGTPVAAVLDEFFDRYLTWEVMRPELVRMAEHQDERQAMLMEAMGAARDPR